MIRIAICDDVSEQVAVIRKAAEYYFAKHKEPVEFTEYTNAFVFLGDLELKGCFDIVLLDVCMPGILGTDVAAEMRRNNSKAEIIFLTASDEFAVQAFAVKAAHYLLKPFTQDDFDDAMERTMERLVQHHSRKLVFRLVGTGIQVEEINDILYAESKGHILLVYLKDGTYFQTRLTLGRFLEMVNNYSPGQFASPGKGYIVNLLAIHVIKSDCIEVQGKYIPLAKGKFREFQENYFKYIFAK
jgi:DNA-binding LytR/AlgR family response regulator